MNNEAFVYLKLIKLSSYTFYQIHHKRAEVDSWCFKGFKLSDQTYIGVFRNPERNLLLNPDILAFPDDQSIRRSES